MRLPTSVLVLIATAAAAACGPSRTAPVQSAAAPSAAHPPDRLLPLDAPARRWVDSTLASLDAKGKAGQMVMAWFSGQYMPVDSDSREQAERWIRDAGVGGVIVSIGQPLALAEKLNRLQGMAAVPLLVATDMEHGPGQRLAGGVLLPWGTDLGGGTEFPPVMAIGAAGDPSLAYELGRVTAREGRAVGIHLDFAPVLDVNNNPANPIINTRSYGEDPGAVARLGTAHIRGLQENGMLATAKHFPGHGDVAGDSHLTPLILRIDAARADSVELVPFRAAIAEGVAAVMTAHIAFPALAGDSVRPATLSPRMLDDLLVRRLGFDGLVVTDALNMGAIVEAFGAQDAALLAVEAGADILLQPQDPARAVDAVAGAVAAGRIPEARLDRSVRKILEAKARAGLHLHRTVDLAGVAGRVGGRAHEAVARRIAERGITLVRDRGGLVPLAAPRARRVLSITYTDDVDPFAGRAFNTALGAGVPALQRVLLGPGTPAAVLDSVARRAAAAELVVLVSEVRVRASKGSVAIEEPVAALFRRVAASKPTVLVSFGSPYVLRQVPDVGSYLLGWGRDRWSHEAAARALLGGAPITGRLPIGIPPFHPLGTGITRDATRAARGAPDSGPAAPPRPVPALDGAVLDSLDRAIAAAIAAGVTPGAALAVGTGAGLVRLRGYGALDWDGDAGPVTDSTLYDVASLTKVVATTTALMVLAERGRIDLDAPLSRHLPEWPAGGWRDGVTIRRLLLHRAGLPPFVRFWHPSAGALRGPDAVVAAIAALPSAYDPGSRTVYSDLGFILLGATVEAVSGRGLDDWLAEEVWGPLGMPDTGFRPLQAGAPLARIAPTELDTVYRGIHVRGVVHDENAYAMGGVAGHAGLFSSARDLARYAAMLLGGGAVGEVRLLRAETLARFTARQPGADRALGWDRRSPEGIGAAFTDAAFGHTGFTGTSLWVDPGSGLFVVLLTNRVNPSRERGGITELRRTVHALVARAAGAAGSGGDGE
ncbi:MAG TPA: glycoside hydrolase family 3 N-terminal domain-containing protein [Longimicrobiales bacterium]|nr:glycoside hydrolase family 3 N-terminal domain-containing protein [Longimicrobiales bacterium]